MNQPPLAIYTITDKPSDFPDKFAVRKHLIGPGIVNVDPDFLVLTNTLTEAQNEMLAMGLVPLPRDPADDPVIIESWI